MNSTVQAKGSVSSEVTLKFPLFSPLLHQKVVFEHTHTEAHCVHFYLSVLRDLEEKMIEEMSRKSILHEDEDSNLILYN